MSIVSLVLALLGLSTLIFLHELGHFLVARACGMRVEVFSIGFGKAMYSWEKDGVRWQLCYLIFGGFVKIAGMESDHTVSDGFYSKPPLQRIAVLFAGPLVNIALAVLFFSLLVGIGGREKPYTQLTPRIGFVDPKSELFQAGIRPGATVLSYDGYALRGARDHLYSAMTGQDTVFVEGHHENTSPFAVLVRPYPHPDSLDSGIETLGVLEPARFLIYDTLPGNKNNPLPAGSPMEGQELLPGDRLIAIDGVRIYSLRQLGALLKEARALCEIERDGKRLQKRIIRVPIDDLRLTSDQRKELRDWQYDLSSVQELLFVPYELNPDGIVERAYKLVDPEDVGKVFSQGDTLEIGDRIVSIDGEPVSSGAAIFAALQKKRVHLTVQRNAAQKRISYDGENLLDLSNAFDADLSDATLVTLGPIEPKPRSAFAMTEEERAQALLAQKAQELEIAKIANIEQRERAWLQYRESLETPLLGIAGLQDRMVAYNPSVIFMVKQGVFESYRTLNALLKGYLSPKWLSGPVGIVHVMQQSWSFGAGEAIFWMAMISLNLGILNLLPIPALDGGYIVLCLVELIRRKPLSPSALERLLTPFIFFLMVLFLFLTYHDLLRLFG